jgi:hypothetical protein
MSMTESQLKELVRKAIAEHDAAKGASQEGESHHSLESIDDCPNCRKAFKADEFKANILKKTWEERKNLHAKCKDCGFPVRAAGRDGYTKETQEESCPNCHSHEAQDRYVWE